tara:strand:+ start:1593 stop:2123 length:531 start_codon:yes stop_codon:yes gene_type:complete
MSQLKVNSIVPVGGLPSGSSGGIIQVVKNAKTDVTSATTIDAHTNFSGANVTITPTLNSNKIFGIFSICYGVSTHHHILNFRIVRGSTVVSDVAAASGGGSTFQTTTYGLRNMYDANGGGFVTLTFLDAPATTSATTYQLQYYSVQAGTKYLNRGGNDSSYYGRGASTFTVMELSA